MKQDMFQWMSIKLWNISVNVLDPHFLCVYSNGKRIYEAY